MMSNATGTKTFAGAGSFIGRMVHGGLLLTGLVTVTHFAVDFLQHDTVSFADTGLPRVHAVTLAAHDAMNEPIGQPNGLAGAADNRDEWEMTSAAVLSPDSSANAHIPVWVRSAGAPAIDVSARSQRGGAGLQSEVVFRPTVRDTVAAMAPDEVALSDEMQRVRDWVSSRYRVSSTALEPVLAEAENSALEAGLDPLLIVAMMAIESSFNPFAQSHMGAQGLMQVIPRWHMDKIGEDAGEDALFDPLLNVQVGTQVLVEGLQRYGSLQAALQYYGGARNDPEARYSKKVLAMKQRIASAARSNGDA